MNWIEQMHSWPVNEAGVRGAQSALGTRGSSIPAGSANPNPVVFTTENPCCSRVSCPTIHRLRILWLRHSKQGFWAHGAYGPQEVRRARRAAEALGWKDSAPEPGGPPERAWGRPRMPAKGAWIDPEQVILGRVLSREMIQVHKFK